MKVAALNGPSLESLETEERPDPDVSPGQILVRVHASSLNYHDLSVVMGRIKTAPGRIPMSDGAGEVIAVGDGVTRFRAGDHVMSTFFPLWHGGGPVPSTMVGVPGDHADGFAAELVAMPEGAFTRIPKGYNFTQAATLPCAALTAWRGLFVESSIKPGDWVLTQGTGGVSLFALQFAKMAGARVIATSSSDEKIEILKRMGADHTINYRQTPKWGKAAFELTGEGVHKIIEVGGAGTMTQSVAASALGGSIALIGVLTGRSGEVPTAAIFHRNITVSGITVGSRQHQEDMIAAIEASDIEPVLDQDFPLSDITGAFEHQISQKHFGKITLSI